MYLPQTMTLSLVGVAWCSTWVGVTQDCSHSGMTSLSPSLWLWVTCGGLSGSKRWEMSSYSKTENKTGWCGALNYCIRFVKRRKEWTVRSALLPAEYTHRVIVILSLESSLLASEGIWWSTPVTFCRPIAMLTSLLWPNWPIFTIRYWCIVSMGHMHVHSTVAWYGLSHTHAACSRNVVDE
jgi:hypothetical protein